MQVFVSAPRVMSYDHLLADCPLHQIQQMFKEDTRWTPAFTHAYPGDFPLTPVAFIMS